MAGPRQTASVTLDGLRVSITRVRDVDNAFDVSINPEVMDSIAPVPPLVRVTLVIDDDPMIIYNDVDPDG